jgi:regulator of sigma E protease
VTVDNDELSFMLEIALKVLAFLSAVFLLILVHEYGHFLVARFFKVKILRFSIGFGKALCKWHDRKHTEYVIALIPLGGYVKMLDAREEKVAKRDLHLAFDRKPVWQRFLIILAGPATNIIFAVLAFWVLFIIGIQAPKPIIGEVIPNSIASTAALRVSDEIIMIGNKKIKDWQDVGIALFSHVGEEGVLAIKVKQLSQDKSWSLKTHSLDLSKWQLDNWQPDPLKDLGIVPYQPAVPTIIDKVYKGSPAARAKLQEKDKIRSINGHDFTDWKDMIEFVQKHPKQQLFFVIERDQKLISLAITTGWRIDETLHKVGYLGVSTMPAKWPAEKVREEQYFWPQAAWPALRQTYDFLVFNAVILEKLVRGKISLHVLGGPLAIFQSATIALQHGFVVYVGFLGLLSLMLAFVNLLPIPVLDGGYILFLGIEAIRRKPLPSAWQNLILRLGMIILLLLMIQGMINDLRRLLL